MVVYYEYTYIAVIVWKLIYISISLFAKKSSENSRARKETVTVEGGILIKKFKGKGI